MKIMKKSINFLIVEDIHNNFTFVFTYCVGGIDHLPEAICIICPKGLYLLPEGFAVKPRLGHDATSSKILWPTIIYSMVMANHHLFYGQLDLQSIKLEKIGKQWEAQGIDSQGTKDWRVVQYINGSKKKKSVSRET